MIPGPDYLRMSYYEKWFSRLVSLSVKAGLITADEAASGRPAAGSVKADPPLKAAAVAGMLAQGGPSSRDVEAPAAAVRGGGHGAGAQPQSHRPHPPARYARGQDRRDRAAARSARPARQQRPLPRRGPQPLYTVRFTARELWGDDVSAGADSVYLEMWESYLEPA